MVPPTDPLGVWACPIDAFGGLGKAQWARLPELCFYRKKPEISQTAGTKMLVSQSIFRLLRNAVARWNQCLICGYLHHVPHSDLQCLKNENFWFFSAIFTHLDRSFNIVHLLNPSGYGLLRYGSRRLQNFKVSRCRLHTFSILGGTDIGGARLDWPLNYCLPCGGQM